MTTQRTIDSLNRINERLGKVLNREAGYKLALTAALQALGVKDEATSELIGLARGRDIEAFNVLLLREQNAYHTKTDRLLP